MTTPDPNAQSHKKMFFFMVSGQVAFYPGVVNEENPIDPTKVQVLVSNTVLFTEENLVRVRDIAQVQNALQMNVISRFKDAEQVPLMLDCVLTGLFPLGYMSQQEFEAGSPMERVRAEQAAAALAKAEEEAAALAAAGIPTQ